MKKSKLLILTSACAVLALTACNKSSPSGYYFNVSNSEYEKYFELPTDSKFESVESNVAGYVLLGAVGNIVNATKATFNQYNGISYSPTGTGTQAQASAAVDNMRDADGGTTKSATSSGSSDVTTSITEVKREIALSKKNDNYYVDNKYQAVGNTLEGKIERSLFDDTFTSTTYVGNKNDGKIYSENKEKIYDVETKNPYYTLVSEKSSREAANTALRVGFYNAAMQYMNPYIANPYSSKSKFAMANTATATVAGKVGGLTEGDTSTQVKILDDVSDCKAISDGKNMYIYTNTVDSPVNYSTSSDESSSEEALYAADARKIVKLFSYYIDNPNGLSVNSIYDTKIMKISEEFYNAVNALKTDLSSDGIDNYVQDVPAIASNLPVYYAEFMNKVDAVLNSALPCAHVSTKVIKLTNNNKIGWTVENSAVKYQKRLLKSEKGEIITDNVSYSTNYYISTADYSDVLDRSAEIAVPNKLYEDLFTINAYLNNSEDPIKTNDINAFAQGIYDISNVEYESHPELKEANVRVYSGKVSAGSGDRVRLESVNKNGGDPNSYSYNDINKNYRDSTYWGEDSRATFVCNTSADYVYVTMYIKDNGEIYEPENGYGIKLMGKSCIGVDNSSTSDTDDILVNA